MIISFHPGSQSAGAGPSWHWVRGGLHPGHMMMTCIILIHQGFFLKIMPVSSSKHHDLPSNQLNQSGFPCGRYLLSEGLPESRHGRRGEGSAGHAAHDHGQPSRTGLVGLHRCSLAQFTAGQMGLVASAVDRIVPVCGLSPASKHPAQMEERD